MTLSDIAELTKGYPRMSGATRFNTFREGRIHNRILRVLGEEPLSISDEQPMAEELVESGLEAFRLTQAYVGEDVLPEIEGWSWYDWTQKARKHVEGKR